MMLLRLHYHCECGHTFEDYYTGEVDNECPACGSDQSVTFSERSSVPESELRFVQAAVAKFPGRGGWPTLALIALGRELCRDSPPSDDDIDALRADPMVALQTGHKFRIAAAGVRNGGRST
ncbi:hypothetical protein [Falsiroseomonas sp. HW251]|uniref:hypothetical protein n=1 Tax=Falsiroseomonas sp. HW251 TaxID=3390998 RepID=UPI003D31ED86